LLQFGRNDPFGFRLKNTAFEKGGGDMPADIWIVNILILVVVLLTDIGHRKVGWGRVVRPFLVALLILPLFVKSPQLSGKGLLLEGVLLIVGALFGVLAAFSLMTISRDCDGRVFSDAGPWYAAFWVVVIGARLVFSYGAYHWYTSSLGHWMYTNHITTNGLTDGLIFLALAMAITRSTRFIPYLTGRAKVEESASLEGVTLRRDASVVTSHEPDDDCEIDHKQSA
jgi:hypothetical protein